MVIPAGGRGQRMGGPVPKQFLALRARPVLHHAIAAFNRHPMVDEIVVVVPADQTRIAEKLIARFKKVSRVVVGGAERQHSVRNGLLAFDREPDIVLVHDAVRPLVTRALIDRVVQASRKFGAAVAGVPVNDTIKVGAGGFFTTTLDRTTLRAVQTPQGFRYTLLRKAHLAAQRSAFIGTDEASLVERLKFPVRIVEGDRRNIKITTRDDLRIAEMLLK